MARVVVIFAILSLITGAMFWLARLPSQHPDVVATIPVTPSVPSTPAPVSEPRVAATAPSSTDVAPPAAASEATSVPPLPTTGAEANLLQQSTTTSAQTGLVVEDVQGNDSSSITLKGRADPGATVKVSVNGKAEGEVTVGGAGTWSISVNKAADATEPQIVLELVAADGKTLDKTNFVVRNAVAAPPLSPQDHTLITAQGAAPKPEEVHRPKRKHRASLRVRRGESLWRIAKRRYGNGDKWHKIYEANKGRIGDDPNHIRPGTRLILPG